MELMECGKSAYEKVMGALEFLRDKDYIILEISDTYAKFKIAQKGIEYFEPKQSSSPITINQGSIIRDNQLSEETLKTASIKGFQRSCLG